MGGGLKWSIPRPAKYGPGSNVDTSRAKCTADAVKEQHMVYNDGNSTPARTTNLFERTSSTGGLVDVSAAASMIFVKR